MVLPRETLALTDMVLPRVSIFAIEKFDPHLADDLKDRLDPNSIQLRAVN
jgi:hypothetical protein